MAKRSATRRKQVDQLAAIVDELRSEREVLAQRLAEIDETFSELGIDAGAAPAAAPARKKKPGRPRKKPGRPRGSTAGRTGKKTTKKTGKKTTKKTTKKTGRRKRGTFSRTGEESVLAFVKELGQATAGDVNKKWTAEGRGGSADNTLGRLVKENKLVREDVPGQRGGVYKLP